MGRRIKSDFPKATVSTSDGMAVTVRSRKSYRGISMTASCVAVRGRHRQLAWDVDPKVGSEMPSGVWATVPRRCQMIRGAESGGAG